MFSNIFILKTIVFIFLLINFASSENNETKTEVDDSWITKGTIDMNALVTMDELWEKQKELEGKVVTLELGKASSSYNGNSKPIKGVLYYHTGMHFSRLKPDDWNNFKDYLNQEKINYSNGDTIFLDSYSVNIVNKGNVTGDLPNWINYNGKQFDFDRRNDLRPFKKSEKKIMSGILLGTYENYTQKEIDEDNKLFTKRKYFEIYPLGIMVFQRNER